MDYTNDTTIVLKLGIFNFFISGDVNDARGMVEALLSIFKLRHLLQLHVPGRDQRRRDGTRVPSRHGQRPSNQRPR